MKKTIDPRDIKWFGPIWRRIALTGAVAVWCGLEWYFDGSLWFYATLFALVYLVWKLFIAFPNAEEIRAYEAEHKKTGTS